MRVVYPCENAARCTNYAATLQNSSVLTRLSKRLSEVMGPSRHLFLHEDSVCVCNQRRYHTALKALFSLPQLHTCYSVRMYWQCGVVLHAYVLA